MGVVYNHWQRIDRAPPNGLGHLSKMWLVASRNLKLESRLRALRLPVDPLQNAAPESFDLVMVAAPKDFGMLRLSIPAALTNAASPDSVLNLIVPGDSVCQVGEVLATFHVDNRINVINEDEILTADFRKRIRENFGERYGWVLQQFLCIRAVLDNHRGVLLIDADTVLIHRRNLLSANRQVLMMSLESHSPYYDFLKNLVPAFDLVDGSHVTHYMLQQPDIWQSILDVTSAGNLENLLDQAIQLSHNDNTSMFSLDFELYAQGVHNLCVERAVLTKWSNRAIAPTTTENDALSQIYLKYQNYMSISCHSFMG